MDKLTFQRECADLAMKYLPNCAVHVRDFDLGCSRGVAICLEKDGILIRHAVRGRTQGHMWTPFWWQFWRTPVYLSPMTPRDAIAELAKWVILHHG